MSDARAVVRALRKRGIEIQCATQMAYLGVDLSRGRRHGRATRQKRMQDTKKQHLTIKRFAASSRRFRILKKVELAGPQAGARHGHQVLGLPRASLVQLRRRLGGVSGHRRGRCLTTLLDIRAPGADPGYALPRQCVEQ
eukprot:4516476-Pyramimonas_sp.AAC.1